MTPMAVSNWPSGDNQRHRAMPGQPHPPYSPSQHRAPYYPQAPPSSGASRRAPPPPRIGSYGQPPAPNSVPSAPSAGRYGGSYNGGYGGGSRSPGGYPGPGGFGAPSGPGATPTTPVRPSLATTADTLPPPLPTSDPRTSPNSNRRPPHPPSLSSPSSRWEPLSPHKPPSLMGSSPTSPRLGAYGGGPPHPQRRSRPTTPAAYDVSGVAFESQSEPPSRPLTAKSSFPEMRYSQDPNGIENFSRPRKQSIRQPVSDTPGRSRPSLLPTPSEEGPEMFHYNPIPNSYNRPRRPSISSNISASTWAPGMSPTAGEFPDFRNGGYRTRNAGPPPVSATRQHFGYHNNRIDSSLSSGSAPAMGGAAPWIGGDEPRSSFRSQLTASSAPGTANTERSSVFTKDSSATSFDANHDADVDADPDEPSIDDLMGMYEQGFEDDDHQHNSQHSLGRGADRDQLPDGDCHPDRGTDNEVDFSRPAAAPVEQRAPKTDASAVDDDELPRPPRTSALDAEIRQSKMFFMSAAFMSSVPHLAAAMNNDDDDDDEKNPEKRDSGKSLESDPSESSHPTRSSRPDINGITPSRQTSSTVDTIRGDLSSSIQSSPTQETPSAPPTRSTYPAPCPPPPGPIETEPPGSRDRYGFKKESQHITRKQYDKWERGYSEYLIRRKKKWTAFLKENALMTDHPNRFPTPGPKTKKFIRKGIPPDWRGAAWFYYAGGPAILAKHGGLYAKLLRKKAKRIDVEAIERDLHRTFPDNVTFRPPGTSQATSGNHKVISDHDTVEPKPEEPPIISSLRRVLFAFSIYNPNIGYCQSLNFIAGLLLLFVDTEEQCFWLLNVITHIYLPGTHEMSLEGSKVDLSVLMTELRDAMPSVWEKIGGELEGQTNGRPSTGRSLRRPKFRRKEQGSLAASGLPPITLCMTAWFMSCFIGTLPIETTLRVWDIFFYEGSKTLFRMALAIFKTGESEILSVSDPMEIFGVVQTLPRKMLDANALMEACFKRRNGFGHLSQFAIDERRQEQREAQKLEKEGRRSKTLPSGNMTEGESGVRRKGTLFGRKKRDKSKARAAEA